MSEHETATATAEPVETRDAINTPAHDSGIEQPVTSQGDGDSGIGETLSPADELPDTGTGDDQA